MTKEEALARIAAEMPHLRKAYHVKTFGIFGSFARGENSDSSDIDILVEFEQPISFFSFIRLEERLANVLGRKVDLVSRKALKEAIAAQVLSETAYV